MVTFVKALSVLLQCTWSSVTKKHMSDLSTFTCIRHWTQLPTNTFLTFTYILIKYGLQLQWSIIMSSSFTYNYNDVQSAHFRLTTWSYAAKRHLLTSAHPQTYTTFTVTGLTVFMVMMLYACPSYSPFARSFSRLASLLGCKHTAKHTVSACRNVATYFLYNGNRHFRILSF